MRYIGVFATPCLPPSCCLSIQHLTSCHGQEPGGVVINNDIYTPVREDGVASVGDKIEYTAIAYNPGNVDLVDLILTSEMSRNAEGNLCTETIRTPPLQPQMPTVELKRSVSRVSTFKMVTLERIVCLGVAG